MRPTPPPPRHKMAVLTFLGLIAPVYFIPSAVAATLRVSHLAVVILSLALIVPLMTYVIMPTLTRVFASWLGTQRSATAGELVEAPFRSPCSTLHAKRPQRRTGGPACRRGGLWESGFAGPSPARTPDSPCWRKAWRVLTVGQGARLHP